MTDHIRECPNCGAYVLSEDRHCPRCDYLLDEPPLQPAVDPGSEPQTAPPETPAGESDDGPAVEIVSEVDLPTTRLPWAKPLFPPAPDAPASSPPIEPEESGDVAPPDEPEDAPAILDATRAHTPPPEPDEPEEPGDVAPPPDSSDSTRAHRSPPPPMSAPEQLPEFAAADDAPEEPVAGEDNAAPEPASDDEAARAEAGSAPQEADTNALEAEEPAAPEVDFAAEKTMPRLTEDLVRPDDEIDAADLDDSEMPTAQFRQRPDEPDVPDESTLVRQQQSAPPVSVPPAPYTPPPALVTPPMPAYAPDPGIAYLQQRVQAYLYGGYRLHVHAPHEATLSQGKQLGVGGWLLALVSIIGFLWYLLIVTLSGFRPDMAYLVLEPDGRVYEDGPGAAHIRRQRSRAGRRWSIAGLVILFLSLGLTVVLIAVAGIVLTQERYQAALREAYPAVTLFEERFSDAQADPDDVGLAETGAVVYAILAGIALLGVWGGATLFVIGTVHAGAYRVSVPPLPGYA